MSTKQGSPDEKTHDAYTHIISCKWTVGPGRKQCGSKRAIKVQDAFQVKYCKAHQKLAAAARRRERAKAKRSTKAAA